MGKALGGARIAPTVAGVTLAAITLALALALALSGCVSADPAVTPQPQASATPLFASDAEALKAAEEAYAAYLKVSDQITSRGAATPDSIEPYVTKAQLAKEIQGFQTVSSRKLHTSGMTRFDNSQLKQYSSSPTTRVSLYLCSDATDVRLMDEAGFDVTPDSRIDRQAFEVDFISASMTKSTLVLSRSEPWSGTDIC